MDNANEKLEMSNAENPPPCGFSARSFCDAKTPAKAMETAASMPPIVAGNSLHSLVSLDEFKLVLGIDDREDTMCKFCLETSTHTIENYCLRDLLPKRHYERVVYDGDVQLPLQEYPVINIISIKSQHIKFNNEPKIEPEFYRVIPDCGTHKNFPYSIELSPSFKRLRGLLAIKLIYSAGFEYGSVPADLEAACLELAAWNMGRYRGKRIGMTGSVRKDGEKWEMSLPENVRGLLEPYRRKVI